MSLPILINLVVIFTLIAVAFAVVGNDGSGGFVI